MPFFKGKEIFFVTNNSTKTQDDYAKRFNDIGYKAKPVRWNFKSTNK